MLCGSNVVEHHFIQIALQSFTGARIILTFRVRIETVMIVFTKQEQEHRKAGNIRPKGCIRKWEQKGQEQEREHIQQKKTMLLSEFWLHFNIVIIFVMTLFNIPSDLPRYSYKFKTIIHVFPIKMLSRRIPYYQPIQHNL